MEKNTASGDRRGTNLKSKTIWMRYTIIPYIYTYIYISDYPIVVHLDELILFMKNIIPVTKVAVVEKYFILKKGISSPWKYWFVNLYLNV